MLEIDVASRGEPAVLGQMVMLSKTGSAVLVSEKAGLALKKWHEVRLLDGTISIGILTFAKLCILSQSPGVKGSMLTVCARGGSRCSSNPT